MLPAWLDVLKNEPVKENLKTSAPLNKFLFAAENLAEIPSALIFEWVSSVSAPIEYFSRGVNRILAIKKLVLGIGV